MSTRIVFPSIGHSPAPSAASTSSQPAHNTLLSQIRNILNPGRPITKPKQAQSNRCLSVETDGGDYELEWDADTVTWKIGGIKRKTWKFDEDAVGKAEYVTTACFAWMDVNDIKTSAGSGSAKAPSASKPTTSTSSPKSSTFAPFAQLRFNQPSSSSTPFLGPKTTASTKRSRSSIGPLYSRCICIFLRHIGRIFTLDGYDYTINVPFAVQSAHPLLPVGILLHATLSDHDPTLPSLYTLTGPFAEFKAMGFATSIEGPVDTAPPGFPLLGPKPKIQPSKKHSIGWDETLLYVSPNGQCQDTREDSIIVTLDQSFCTLKVWRYVYVKTDTAPKPLRRKGAKAKAAAQTLGVGVTPLSAPPKSSKRKVAQTFDDPPLAPDDIFFMSPHTRHGSQTRNELSVTLDRMALGGTGEGEGTGLKGKGKAPMMNVGIEEESVPPEENASKGKMKADYWLEKLWEGEVDKDDDGSTVSVCQYDRRHVLPASYVAMIFGRTLHLFNLDHEDNKLVMKPIPDQIKFPAISMAAVVATRRDVKDLLVMRPDGSLRLFAHDGNGIDVDIEDNEGRDDGNISVEMVPGEDIEMSPASPRITRASLSSPARSSVNLVYTDGSSTRLSTHLYPQSIPVALSFQALAFVLPSPTLWAVRMEYLKRRRFGNEREEWRAFEDAVLEIVSAGGVTAAEEEEARRVQAEGENDAWTALADSTAHSKFSSNSAISGLSLPAASSKRVLSSPGAASNHAPFLWALHLLGEDLKFNVSYHYQITMLAPLLIKLAKMVRWEWADYWARWCPEAADGWDGVQVPPITPDQRLPSQPPDIQAILYNTLPSLPKIPALPSLRSRMFPELTPSMEYGLVNPTFVTHVLYRTFLTLATPPVDIESSRRRAQAAVLLMIQHGMSRESTELLPFSVGTPIWETLRTCQIWPPGDWPAEAYALIGRDDLAKFAVGELGAFGFGDAYRQRKALVDQVEQPTVLNLTDNAKQKAEGRSDEATSRLNLGDFTDVRWGMDRRLGEAENLLDASKTSVIKLEDRGLNEHQLAKEQQSLQMFIAERTLALAFGRAALTIGSISSINTNIHPIPKIEYSVKILPDNTTLVMDLQKLPLESRQWGDFHNGVAAALRIDTSAQGVDSAWIKFNKPAELTAEHAGFLFGLGLNGHLRTMVDWHAYQYLTPKHEFTSVALLLGLSATYLGTGDPDVTRILSIHTPPLLPKNSADLNIPLAAQTAGLMGIGLLYLGTQSRKMADMALGEISRRRGGGPELSNEHLEAYAITAGLAFGMIMCGHGGRTNSPVELQMLATLRTLILGEPAPVANKEPAKPKFDINVTSPAATVALALMYLKSNRQDVAALLDIPQTPLGLSLVQPNFLLLRVMGRGLIMWDEMKPREEWVMKQVPVFTEDELAKKSVKDSHDLAWVQIVSGACMAIGLKYAGSANIDAYTTLVNFLELLAKRNVPGTGFDNQIKRTAVREAQNIIGVCIGAVLAGSGEIMVMRALRYNHGCWGPGWRYGTHMATHLSIGLLFLGGGRYTLGNSNAAVACLLASLFPRFPPHLGETRGLLQAFRHLWALAIEPRCMLTRDADTGETVYLPVKVKRADESGLRTMEMYSPTLLPDFDPIVSISIDTPRYWPITIDLSNPRHRETFLRTQTIYVKRRPGSSQYKEDPKGSRSMLVRHLVGDPSILDLPEKCQGKPTATDEFYLLLDSKLTDPSLIAFADRFCRNYAHDDASPREQILFAFCQQTLLECLTYDKPQTIHAHLSLFQAQFAPSPITVRDLLFAESFYKLFVAYGGVVDSTPRHPLIRLSALRSALYTMEERMQTLRRSPRFMSALRQYVRGEAVAPEEGVAERKRLLSDLALYLTRESVPSLQVLQDIRTMALETFSVPSDDPHTVHTAVMLISRTPVVGKQAIGAPSWTFQSVDEILTLWK